MSELEKKNLLSEDELDTVTGGATKNYLAALDVMNGKYGNGEERKARLAAAGYITGMSTPRQRPRQGL